MDAAQISQAITKHKSVLQKSIAYGVDVADSKDHILIFAAAIAIVITRANSHRH
jgi:hypothetical protein